MSGGSMMTSVPAMATFQSGMPKAPGISSRSSITAVPWSASVVTSSGQRYWFQAHTNMLAAGSILVPALLASTTSRWFTEIIQQWMFESQDWNTGSAYAFLLMLLCTVFVTVMMRVFRVSLADIAK